MYLFQVNVEIYDIISSCKNRQCGFNYTNEDTPILHSIQPNFGSHGDVVTLNCSGCGGVGENSVTIGGGVCNITAEDETSITCVLGTLALLPIILV